MVFNWCSTRLHSKLWLHGTTSVHLGMLELLTKEDFLVDMFAATKVCPQSLLRLELAPAEQADKYYLLSGPGILLSIPVENNLEI